MQQHMGYREQHSLKPERLQHFMNYNRETSEASRYLPDTQPEPVWAYPYVNGCARDEDEKLHNRRGASVPWQHHAQATSYPHHHHQRQTFETPTRIPAPPLPMTRRQCDHELRGDFAGAHLSAPVWSTITLTPFVSTERYEEHPDVAKLTPQDVCELYRSMEVTVEGTDLPRPVKTFEQAPFPSWIIHELYRSGYTAPYPVQAVGWVVALQTRDMIGIAKTGSGKTLAYLLPGIVHIEKQPPLRPGDGPILLVLAPTRELAMQIEREARRFASLAHLSVACIYGGVPRQRQVTALRHGMHICIVTPGRFLEFLEAGVTNLQRVTYLVLDEADRMLDMGFEPQIRRLVAQVRPDRQTLMWSATWPRAIQQLARELCRTAPVRITVGSHELQANENIRQIIDVCSATERFPHLLNYLRTYMLNLETQHGPQRKGLVFCETKRGCDVLYGRLKPFRDEMGGINVIHGNKDQVERDKALAEFTSGKCKILIATDVASRGLDIKGVGLVINYDIPKTVESYIHRIGRTGRAGETGIAITLFSDIVGDSERARMAKEMCTVMHDVGQTPPQELMALAVNALELSSHEYQSYRFSARHGGQGWHGRKARGGRALKRPLDNCPPRRHREVLDRGRPENAAF